jgi:Dyp-type peroxidase family
MQRPIGDKRKVIDRFKTFLKRFTPSTGEETLDDRRKFRAVAPAKRRNQTAANYGGVLIAIGFSSVGLKALTPGAADIPSEAFRLGLAARSELLGDPRDPSNEGHVSNWRVGRPGRELDAIIIVAGNQRMPVTARARVIIRQLRAVGAKVSFENGDVRKDDTGHEHFGFNDGISQPGIRGRASTRPNDFITNRHLPPAKTPDAWLYGYPGQDLVWPGEFVLGYPKTSPDPLLPGPSAILKPEWTRNGSFLVFRRLRQDVELFWRTMRSEANRLSALPGFAGLTDERLAALLVGRWRSGAPISRVPKADNQTLGNDPVANNNFIFDSHTTWPDRFPSAHADPVGLTCPLVAHIRKVNTRDSSSDMGARSSAYDRRILRVGVPFGKSLLDHYAQPARDPEKGNRGLLFLSIQSSIEDQFEFLQSRWINDPARPKAPSGNDMIVGQNAATAGSVRRCVIFGSGLGQAELSASGQFVIPTGGGYFFVPSISALRSVIGS